MCGDSLPGTLGNGSKISQPIIDPLGWMVKPGTEYLYMLLRIGEISRRKYSVRVLKNMQYELDVFDWRMLWEIRIRSKLKCNPAGRNVIRPSCWFGSSYSIRAYV